MRKYLLNPDFDAISLEDIGDFLNAYNAGSLQPFLKSQPEVPTHDGKIRILVGTNHDSLITGSEIFVMYYVPQHTTGNSIQLWSELAASTTIKFAKFNIHENELPSLKIPRLPTFRYHAQNGKFRDFTSQDEVTKFVKSLSEKQNEEL